jgi:probable rRNA maturation factor
MQSGIYFFKADVRFRFLKRVQVANWIKSVIKREGKHPGEITFVFCSDKYLLDLNRRFLNHDYYTDIITFDSTTEKAIAGEIYISIDRVNENAADLKVSFDQELRRVIIHGVLHLLGYADSSKAQKEAMRLKEDACLSLLPVPRGTKG